MKLVVLGSNAYRPTDLGQTACYAIPELGIVLDAGAGMWRLADYLETPGLGIYLSHPHPDHTWGLVYLESMFWRQMARKAAMGDGKVKLGPIFGSLLSSPPLVRVHVAQEHRRDVESQIGHSHTTPVARVAAEARVGRLLLVHLNALRPHAGEPDLHRARDIFPSTEVAFDGMEIEF